MMVEMMIDMMKLTYECYPMISAPMNDDDIENDANRVLTLTSPYFENNYPRGGGLSGHIDNFFWR